MLFTLGTSMSFMLAMASFANAYNYLNCWTGAWCTGTLLSTNRQSGCIDISDCVSIDIYRGPYEYTGRTGHYCSGASSVRFWQDGCYHKDSYGPASVSVGYGGFENKRTMIDLVEPEEGQRDDPEDTADQECFGP